MTGPEENLQGCGSGGNDVQVGDVVDDTINWKGFGRI